MKLRRLWSALVLMTACGPFYEPPQPPTGPYLTIDASSRFAWVGTPSPELRVVRRSVDGAVLRSDAAISVQLRVVSGSGGFSTSANQAPAAALELTIPPGDFQSPPTYFLGLAPGKATLEASGDGLATGSISLELPGESFGDDFESGSLRLGTIGAWDSSRNLAPHLLSFITPGHRGEMAMRVHDGSDNGGQAATGTVAWAGHATVPATGSRFFRAWVRAQATSDVGAAHLLTSWRTGTIAAAEVQLTRPGNTLALTGYSAGLWQKDITTSSLAQGEWALIELAIRGMGSASGERELWVNGVKVASRQGIDFSGNEFLGENLGMGWSNDLRFTGDFDFDDFRASVVPPADQLVLATRQPRARCQALEVSLHSRLGEAAARAPYDVEVTLDGLMGSTVFGDASCSKPVEAVRLKQGAERTVVYVQGSPLTLVARHEDFLPSDALELTNEGLSCSSAEYVVPGACGVWLVWRRRRRGGARAGPRPRR